MFFRRYWLSVKLMPKRIKFEKFNYKIEYPITYCGHSINLEETKWNCSYCTIGFINKCPLPMFSLGILLSLTSLCCERLWKSRKTNESKRRRTKRFLTLMKTFDENGKDWINLIWKTYFPLVIMCCSKSTILDFLVFVYSPK